VSADAVVPGAGNPQALNRYSYVFNNPLKYTDPSGHDPLGDEWRNEFRERHGYDPTTEDEMIRLFSIAYPNEWDWNKFYDANGSRRSWDDIVNNVFRAAPSTRSWDTMPDALSNLLKAYTPEERDGFVQDVGFLYAGLQARSQRGIIINTRNGPESKAYWEIGAVNEQIFILPGGFKEMFYVSPTQGGNADADANVHHWAWAFTLGYNVGARLAVSINGLREYSQRANGWVDTSDIYIGERGAQMGASFWWGTDLRFLFQHYLRIGR
jgi:hypothetical protein